MTHYPIHCDSYRRVVGARSDPGVGRIGAGPLRAPSGRICGQTCRRTPETDVRLPALRRPDHLCRDDAADAGADTEVHHAPDTPTHRDAAARHPDLDEAPRPCAAGHHGRAVADLRHLQRRVAQLRRRHRGEEVLAAGPDRRRQLRRPGAGLGMDVRRQPRQQDDAGRRRVVGAARRRRRGPRRGDAQPLPDRPPAEPDRLPGHAADGRRGSLLQHAAVAGRRRRRSDRRDAVGLQPQELRRGDDDDDRDVAPAGRGLLDRRRGRRAHLLGHGQRLRGLRRRRRPAGRAPTSAPTAAAWSMRWSASRGPPAASATT